MLYCLWLNYRLYLYNDGQIEYTLSHPASLDFKMALAESYADVRELFKRAGNGFGKNKLLSSGFVYMAQVYLKERAVLSVYIK